MCLLIELKMHKTQATEPKKFWSYVNAVAALAASNYLNKFFRSALLIFGRNNEYNLYYSHSILALLRVLSLVFERIFHVQEIGFGIIKSFLFASNITSTTGYCPCSYLHISIKTGDGIRNTLDTSEFICSVLD